MITLINLPLINCLLGAREFYTLNNIDDITQWVRVNTHAMRLMGYNI